MQIEAEPSAQVALARRLRVRATAAISRFYTNTGRNTAQARSQSRASHAFGVTQDKIQRKKGFPRFKKHSRSIEYKTTGWKLSENRKKITFTDKNNIGQVKLKRTRDLNWYDIKISRQRKDHAIKLARLREVL